MRYEFGDVIVILHDDQSLRIVGASSESQSCNIETLIDLVGCRLQRYYDILAVHKGSKAEFSIGGVQANSLVDGWKVD